MEVWIIYAILSAIFAWIYNFLIRTIAHKNYDTSLVTIYSYKIWFIISWLIILLNPSILEISIKKLILILLFSLWNIIFFLSSLISRVESMKNIDSVIFFPLYKTFWPIIITILSLFVYNETLTTKESIWIIIGITIPLLLITKSETKIQKSLTKWIILMFVTVILTAISTQFWKLVVINNIDIILYLFFSAAFWVILSYITHKNWKKKNKKFYERKIKRFSLLAWIMRFFSFYFFALALVWNLAIMFTINSFSILIPIILSVIFYKEHFNFRKFVVIILSIISIILFI